MQPKKVFVLSSSLIVMENLEGLVPILAELQVTVSQAQLLCNLGSARPLPFDEQRTNFMSFLLQVYLSPSTELLSTPRPGTDQRRSNCYLIVVNFVVPLNDVTSS